MDFRLPILTASIITMTACQLDSEVRPTRLPPGHISIAIYVGSGNPAIVYPYGRDRQFVEKIFGDVSNRVALFTELLNTDHYRDEYEEIARHEKMSEWSYDQWRIQAAFKALALNDRRLDTVVARYFLPGIDPQHPPDEDAQLAAGVEFLYGSRGWIRNVERGLDTRTVHVSTSHGPLSGGESEVVFSLREHRGILVWLPSSDRLIAIN